MKSSKYALKGKPMPYSETYKAWKAAAMAGRTDEAANLAEKHRARFGSAPQRKEKYDAR